MMDREFKLRHQEFYSNKSVLVTGHTGFKGGWLTKTLMLLRSRVTGFSNQPDYQPNLDAVLGLSNKISAYYGDVTNLTALLECFGKEQPELIFHLAAKISNSSDDFISTYRTNLIGTLTVLEAARKIKSVKAVVVVTTDKVYKNNESLWPFRENDPVGGNDLYSSSKACVEVMTETYREWYKKQPDAPAIATARAGNVIGGGDWFKDRIIPDIIKCLLEWQKPIEIRNPEAVRPWQHVLPVIEGYLLLGKKLYVNKAEFATSWNFSPEKTDQITVQALVEKAIAVLGNGSYRMGGNPEKPERKTLRLDSSKAKQLLGWVNAMPLDQALQLTLEWYRGYYENKDMQKITDIQITQFFKNGHPT